jgi:hypothetical protein
MSVSTCRHCKRKYDVTDDLRKAGAACPFCYQPLRQSREEHSQEVLDSVCREIEAQNKDTPFLHRFFVEDLARGMMGKRPHTFVRHERVLDCAICELPRSAKIHQS